MKTGAKLYLVGAGPGDPDLITVKGIKVLEQADVVLYDALANPLLLGHAAKAEKIFVGKRKGMHRYRQEDIHQLILLKSKNHHNIVRLKGGDPFIFGRGSEEIDFARRHGLETEVVPGISSCMAVPASIGVPLTERGASESFWVITGCNSDRKLSNDLKIAAMTSATVVVLMGMHKLAEIVRIYQDLGKGELPVAIIQNGTLPTANYGFGKVENILEVAAKKELSSPAIIVLGKVAKCPDAISLHIPDTVYEMAS